MAGVTTSSIITNIRGLIKDLAKTDGRDVFEYDDDNAFLLGQNYVISSTITVYRNNTLLSSSDWSFSSTTNKVTITGVTLNKGDIILIVYNYYAKYSDDEIKGYIKSNLTKFVQNRYKKLFYMNDLDEIVTHNGANPTVEEGNIIAILTAIDIDPQNVTIRLPDFTISATESKSKSEQVQELFEKWLRSFGTVDFLEDETSY